MSIQSIMNSPILWIGVTITMLAVFFQVYVILSKSIKVAYKMNIEKQKIKSAITSSAITAVGPAIVGVLSGIPLAMLIGIPIALLRIMVIGSPEFELICAQIGLSTLGVTNGSLPTAEQFLGVILAITVAISLPVPVSIIFAGRLEKTRRKLVKTNSEDKRSFATLFVVSSLLGSLFLIDLSFVQKISSASYAWFGGVAMMLILSIANKKKPIRLLQELSLPISAIFGMIIPIFMNLF